MPYEPKVGQYLYASCSDADVYEIIAVGKDYNDCPTIDVRVLDLNEILHFSDDNDANSDGSDGKWTSGTTNAELPEGIFVILRDMQWRICTPGYENAVRINVNAPEGGCYGCCYLFSVHSSPGGRSPVIA